MFSQLFEYNQLFVHSQLFVNSQLFVYNQLFVYISCLFTIILGGRFEIWDNKKHTYGLRPRVPVPQEDGAVLRAGHDVAVRGDVALGPGQAGHDAVVAKDDLADLGRLGGKHPGKGKTHGSLNLLLHRQNGNFIVV